MGERASYVVEAEFRKCLLPLRGQLLFPVVDVDPIAFFEEVGFVLIWQRLCSFRFQVFFFICFFSVYHLPFFTQQSMLLLLCCFASLTQQKKRALPTCFWFPSFACVQFLLWRVGVCVDVMLSQCRKTPVANWIISLWAQFAQQPVSVLLWDALFVLTKEPVQESQFTSQVLELEI